MHLKLMIGRFKCWIVICCADNIFIISKFMNCFSLGNFKMVAVCHLGFLTAKS